MAAIISVRDLRKVYPGGFEALKSLCVLSFFADTRTFEPIGCRQVSGLAHHIDVRRHEIV